MTFAIFSADGYFAVSKELLNMIVSGLIMQGAQYLMSLGDIPSGPLDLFGFSLLISLLISCSEVGVRNIVSSILLDKNFLKPSILLGSLEASSGPVLQICLFMVFAISWSFDMVMPSFIGYGILKVFVCLWGFRMLPKCFHIMFAELALSLKNVHNISSQLSLSNL